MEDVNAAQTSGTSYIALSAPFARVSSITLNRLFGKSSDTQMVIGDAKQLGGTNTNNAACIPLAIYGCK